MSQSASEGTSCPRCGAAAAPDARFCHKCGTRLPVKASWDAPVPERLAAALGPDYTIVGELGRGGFAVVYSVKDLRVNRYLAVKVMRPDLVASPTTVERFRREAQYVAQLDHPNILPVAFAGEAAGLVYYAMPRVRGITLRERLRQSGRLEIAQALEIFGAVAEALDHAHRRGVVHRDIKPANIMLEQSGRVLVLDFGIAKALSADGGSLSISGAIIGSAEYMSPEQASGSKNLDPRTDIYSLGVVGFEMLTGETPFEGDGMQQMLAKQVKEAPDVRQLRPETPGAFAHAISRCLMKDRRDRWPSALEAARAARGK
ncbi:Serine/threonine-protein kinase PknB [bacterium HR33]|nr:Serine/threonine-protein kinase PknB [bacterium HR33]